MNIHKNIKLVPYDPHWPKIFEREAATIREALGPNSVALHHIGSTSVPGLAAKPKIDMIAVVKDPWRARTQLEKIGIQYRGEYNIPLHHGFSKRDTVDLNLHVYEESHPEIELNLTFRDYLRNHPQARDDYAHLKQSLLEDESSFIRESSAFANYTLRKGDFIRNILKEAGFKALRMLKCNDETEWNAVRYFRHRYFFDPLGIDDPYTWTFNHENHAHLILYKGWKIIGYAHIQFWPSARAALRIIVIEEEKRNQNSGSLFLGLCEKWLKALGVKSVHAESRSESLNFYRKNGYVETSFHDPDGHEPGPHDIPMGKILMI